MNASLCRAVARSYLREYVMPPAARIDEIDRLVEQIDQIAKDYCENLGVERRR